MPSHKKDKNQNKKENQKAPKKKNKDQAPPSCICHVLTLMMGNLKEPSN